MSDRKMRVIDALTGQESERIMTDDEIAGEIITRDDNRMQKELQDDQLEREAFIDALFEAYKKAENPQKFFDGLFGKGAK